MMADLNNAELVEKYVQQYGEDYRRLFEDALPWWRQTVDKCDLEEYDWDGFVECLLSRVVTPARSTPPP
jgi:hypothetical protein